MDPFEQQLKQALARKDAPAGFAERVAAKTRRHAMPRWMATAAAVVVLASGAGMWRYREGVRAKEQVMLAMRVTAEQLNQIQVRVREAGR
jgi:hypothetical protein